MPCTFLVPLDGSPFAERALPTALSLVKERQGRLELVYVHEARPIHAYDDAPWNAAHRSRERSYVADKARELTPACPSGVGHTLLTGDAADVICARARAVDADMIVMTTHGRTGVARAWNGSVADAVIRRASLPVLVLRQPADGAPRRSPPRAFLKIVVVVDESSDPAPVLDAVSTLAIRGGSELHLLRIVAPVPHVVDISFPFGYATEPGDDPATNALVAEAGDTLRDLAITLEEKSGCDVVPHVWVGRSPAEDILKFAWKYGVDLIALTTGTRAASRWIIGSLADKVLRNGTTPVLVVRGATRTSRIATSQLVTRGVAG